MPHALVNGLQLHYELAPGPAADAPAAVFLHGLGSSAADWALQRPVFAARHRVITLDLRAHGQSSDGGGRFTIEMMADDVAALLAHLHEPPAHIVALSLGGCVALALAARYPERVRSLALVNTFAKYQPHGVDSVARAFKRLWLLSFAPMSSVAEFVAGGLFPKPEQRPFYEATVRSLSKNPKRTYFNALRAVRAFDMRPRLAQIACPTLVVAGDVDTTVPMSAKLELSRNIPNAEMLVIPDSGHATPYDQTERFNRAVLDFLAAH